MAGIEISNRVGPAAASGVVVWRKFNFDDEWELDEELIPISCQLSAGAGKAEEVKLVRHYGSQIRPVGEVNAVDREPIDLRREWIKIALLVGGEQNVIPQTIFVGQVENQVNAIWGSDVGSRANGVQTFAVRGPTLTLQKKTIHESYWLAPQAARQFERDRLGRTFSFNRRTSDGRTEGNRASTTAGHGSFLFSSDKLVWNWRQIADYFVEQFLNQRDEQGNFVGPRWYLSGAARGYLKELRSPFEMKAIMKLSDVFAQLISPMKGLDFFIKPLFDDEDVDDGFEIDVFALQNRTIEYVLERGDPAPTFRYPKNGPGIELDVSSRIGMTATVEPAGEFQYDGVRLISDPIITVHHWRREDLVPAWEGFREVEYKAGDPTPNAGEKEHDAARTRDDWRGVYQAHRVIETWEPTAPFVDLDGSFDQSGKFQRTHRTTQRSTNLKEGENYEQGPGRVVTSPTDDLKPLLTMIYTPVDGVSRWVIVDQIAAALPEKRSASVGPLDNEWGFHHRSTPNHAFARGHFAGAAASQFDPFVNGVNYLDIAATVSLIGDERAVLGVDRPENEQSGNKLIKTIRVPGTVFVYLPSQTTFDITKAGAKRFAQGGDFIRADFRKLAREMPGAIARYLHERAAAVITVTRLENWNVALGRILDGVQNSGERELVETPITSVTWNFETRTTTIRTGHANT